MAQTYSCQSNQTLLSLGYLLDQQYKVEVYQQQIDMEKLCHQGELLLKKVSDQTDRDMIQEPLIELRHLWDNLGDKITQRQVLSLLQSRNVTSSVSQDLKITFFQCCSLRLLFLLEYFMLVCPEFLFLCLNPESSSHHSTSWKLPCWPWVSSSMPCLSCRPG